MQAWRGSGRNARLCGSLAPSLPRRWCPGAAGVRASAAAAIQHRTFLCEAAVPHHANALTKRRRYYGKDFSASYSRVRDSATGRAGSSLGISWEPAPASAPYLATAWGWQSRARSSPRGTVGPSPSRPHCWDLGKIL